MKDKKSNSQKHTNNLILRWGGEEWESFVNGNQKKDIIKIKMRTLSPHAN